MTSTCLIVLQDYTETGHWLLTLGRELLRQTCSPIKHIRWMARHRDGCMQVIPLQPRLEFDLSGASKVGGSHTLSFRDVEYQNELRGGYYEMQTLSTSP